MKKVVHKKDKANLVSAIRKYKCPTCGTEHPSYDQSPPNCPICATRMSYDGMIQESVVREIKNRTLLDDGEPEEPDRLKKTRADKFNDFGISSVQARVHPRSGGPSIDIWVAMDKKAYEKYLVAVDWDDVAFTTDLGAFNDAFELFYWRPVTFQKEGIIGDPVTETTELKPKGGRTNIGPIGVMAGPGKNQVVFTHGDKRAVFDMTDIALQLSNAF